MYIKFVLQIVFLIEMRNMITNNEEEILERKKKS